MDENFYKKIFSKNLKYYMSINQKTQIDIINDLGINKSAISTWCNGTRLPRMDKIDMLAKYFHINRSDLIEEHEINGVSSLTKKDEKDIEKILESTREQLINQEGLMFDGEPATPEAVESILSAMEVGMEMAKKKNKEKYTPKKYRKKD